MPGPAAIVAEAVLAVVVGLAVMVAIVHTPPLVPKTPTTPYLTANHTQCRTDLSHLRWHGRSKEVKSGSVGVLVRALPQCWGL